MNQINAEYVLSADDLIAATHYHRDCRPDGTLKPFLRRWIVPALVGCLAAFILYRLVFPLPRAPEQSPQSQWGGIVFLGFIVFFCLLYLYRRLFYAAIIRRAFRNARGDSPLRRTIYASFSTESFASSNNVVSETLSWGAVPRIVVTPDRLFLASEKQNIYVVPKRAFSDSSNWLRVLDLLTVNFPGELHGLARDDTPTETGAVCNQNDHRSQRRPAGEVTPSSPDAIIIDFQPTAADSIAFQRYLSTHLPDGRPLSRVHRNAVTFFPLIFNALIIWGVLNPQVKPGEKASLTSGSVVAIIVWTCATLLFVFRRAIRNAWIRRKFRKSTPDSILLQHRTLAISPTAFSIRTLQSTAILKWEVFKRIVFTRDYLFLMVSTKEAHIIPHRVLADPAEWSRLLTMLKSNFPGELHEEVYR